MDCHTIHWYPLSFACFSPNSTRTSDSSHTFLFKTSVYFLLIPSMAPTLFEIKVDQGRGCDTRPTPPSLAHPKLDYVGGHTKGKEYKKRKVSYQIARHFHSLPKALAMQGQGGMWCIRLAISTHSDPLDSTLSLHNLGP